MKKSIPTLEGQEERDFEELMTANKCLAMEKRELHRHKLRVYSQKAVKLRAILRETSDPEEKKCLETKLKALQQKQDAEITKLAKIDQIEKEIDGFMTEQNDDTSNRDQTKENNRKVSQSSNKSSHDTPAQRLRTKSSINYQGQQETVHVDFSRKKSNAFKDKQSEELLLNDSRHVLEELNNDRINRTLTQTNSKPSLKSKKRQYQQQLSKKNEGSFQFPQIAQPINDHQNVEDYQGSSQALEGVPESLKCLVEKVSKFWPLQIKNLIKYLRGVEESRLQMGKRQQRLRRDEERVKRCQQRSKNIDQKVLQLVEKERFLMQTIDRLEKEQRSAEQQVEKSLQDLANAAEIISKSSLIPETEDPVKVSCFLPDSVHKFSVQSFESFREGSTLAVELSHFQKAFQGYLLSAERAVMKINAEYKQTSTRLAKSQEEVPIMQSRKRGLEQQINRVESWLKIKESSLKEMEEQVRILKDQMDEYGGTVDLKKALVAELQEKGQKLKLKKKATSDRLKRVQDDVQSLTLKKEQLFEQVLSLQQKVVGMKTYQKELQTKIIFCQRDKQNREQDLKMLQQKGEQIMKRITQSNRVNEDAIDQMSRKKAEVSKLNDRIEGLKEEEQEMMRRVESLRKTSEEEKYLIEEKRGEKEKLTEELVMKQTQLVQLKQQIGLFKNKIKKVQEQYQECTSKLTSQKELLQKQQQQIQDTISAKEDLEGLLHEVIMKKQEIMAQLEEKSKELALLLGDLQNGQEDYQLLVKNAAEMQMQIEEKQQKIKEHQSEYEEIREELDEQIQEEENIIARITRLKEVQRTMLVGIGIKGGSSYLDEELRGRVNDAVQELNNLNDLKSQLKDCKYENRKLKLQNQRLTKLVEGE